MELWNFHASSYSLSFDNERRDCGVFQGLYFYQKYVFRRSRKGKGPTVGKKDREKRTHREKGRGKQQQQLATIGHSRKYHSIL